jgi:EmrB/QacA subfamily drug resistance transporter
MNDSRHRGVMLTIILAGYAMAVLDVSIVMAALPRIQHVLGFSPTGLSWVHNAYALTFGGLLLVGARAGDLLGRRRMFIAGIALFTAASLATGLAQSPAWMIGARAVQGIGAAILAPATLALLSTNFPEGHERTRAMAAYGAVAGVATAAGLVLGGLFTDTLSWRVGFFINVPIGIAAIVLAPRYIGETDRRPGRFDAVGGFVSTLGASLLVYGIVRSASAGWGDTVTVLSLLAGLLLIAGFVAGQSRAAQPIMPPRLFASRERSGAYAARFLFTGALVSQTFFMTQYLQGVSGFSPLRAGLAFLPLTIVVLATAIATPRLTRRFGTARLLTAGIATMLIATAWLSHVSVETAYLTGVALPMIVYGVGQALGLSTLTTAGMSGVASADAGAAGGVVNVVHHLGGAVGLGILVTVFDAAGSADAGARELLADRVSAALTGATALLAIALVAVLVIRPRRAAALGADDLPSLGGLDQHPALPRQSELDALA